MTTTRGLGSTTQYNGGSARWEGTEDKQRTVSIKDLPLESQTAHEILKLLRECDPRGRARVLEVAHQKDPVTQQGLAGVASLFQRLEMPLSAPGIQRFKADRGLGGGTALNPACAKAYARAVNGGEVLFRVDRGEEANLRPADKACLGFLRTWSRSHGAEAVGRLKEALDLGNPEVGPDAAALANEYVGVNTVREVSKASSMRNCPLTPEGMEALSSQLEAEKAKVAAATTAASPTTTTKLQRPASAAPKIGTGATTTTLTRPPSKAPSAAAAASATSPPRMPATAVTSMSPRPKR
jgi:hypothetical protein